MSADIATVLFTDIEGSTAHSSLRGDDDAMAMLRAHERALRTAAEAHRGTIVKSTGDGYLSAFPTVADGVAAAFAARAALAHHNRANPDSVVQVRYGLNAGPVIREAGDLYGLAVNAAARVTAKAAAGQVLISATAMEALVEEGHPPEWKLADAGLFWLKGIREQWRLYEVSDGDLLSPTSVGPKTLPLVGRDGEMAGVRQVIDAAADGHGAALFLTGATGIGKTRVTEAAVAEATARGLRAVAVRSGVHDAGRPYGAVAELLEAAMRTVPATDLPALLGDGATEVVRLLPALRQRLPHIGDGPEWPVQEAQRILFSAVRDLLGRLSSLRPLLLVIDDLHNSDDPSLSLLGFLVDGLESLPIGLLLTYADDEPRSAEPAFRFFVADSIRRRLASTITLAPLDPAATNDFVRALVDDAPAELIARLHEASGGNAFLLEELARQLREQASGAIADVGGPDPELVVSDSIRYALQARIEQLRPPTRELLTVAAVAGSAVDFDVLEAVGGLDEDDLLDALDDAERARVIIAEDAGGAVRFSFPHGLMRTVLAGDLSLTRRQRLHLRIAVAMEAKADRDASAQAGEIARHLQSAGRWADPARLVHHLVVAGDRALEAAAFGEALDRYASALERSAGGLLADDVRARLLERMGDAERSLGHLDEALAMWDEALAIHAGRGARHDVARLCLAAAVQVAWWRQGSEVADLVDRGLRALGDDDSPLRAGFLALRGAMASQRGSYDDAARVLDEALSIARRSADEGLLGLTLYTMAVHHFGYYHYENVVTVGRASERHLRAAGDLWNLANVKGYVGTALGWLGRFEEAAVEGRAAAELADRLGNWSATVFAEGATAFLEIAPAAAAPVLERRGNEAVELGTNLGFRWLRALGNGRLGLAAFWRGEWEDALRLLEEAAGEEGRSASGGHAGRLFLLHAYLGDRTATTELIGEVEAAFPVVGRPNSGTSWTLALAAVEAWVTIGDRDRAAALYPTVLDHAGTGTLMRSWDYRLVSSLAGLAAGAAGEWDEAFGHFESARRLAVELPMQHELPDALRFEAEVRTWRSEPGDLESAMALLTDAAVRYDELGMVRHARLARDRGSTIRLAGPPQPTGAAAALGTEAPSGDEPLR